MWRRVEVRNWGVSRQPWPRRCMFVKRRAQSAVAQISRCNRAGSHGGAWDHVEEGGDEELGAFYIQPFHAGARL